jgi:hypothetical protein
MKRFIKLCTWLKEQGAFSLYNVDKVLTEMTDRKDELDQASHETGMGM